MRQSWRKGHGLICGRPMDPTVSMKPTSKSKRNGITSTALSIPPAKRSTSCSAPSPSHSRDSPPHPHRPTASTAAGNRAAATIQKTGTVQVEYPPRSTPVAKELEGEWKGDYEMLGYTRHVSIKFANHPDGATADFVIVGRKHNVLPVDLVTQEGEMVTVDSHEMGFSFEGRLRNGKLSGAIRQAAMETPLVLVRAK